MRRLSLVPVLLLAIGLVLSGCASKHSTKKASLDPFAGTGSPYYKGKGPIPFGGGRYAVGKPYQVAGRWFTPKEQPSYDKTGTASWYGEAFHRRKTSNGEWFDMNQLTAAHATLPLPSYVKVSNLENGREVVVRVNDRGPFVGPRIIDMSKRAAEVLGYKQNGKTTVRVQYIGPAPLNDKGEHLVAMNKELSRGTPLRQMIAAADSDLGRGTVQLARAEPAPEVAAEEPQVQEAVYQPPAAPAPVPSSGIGQDYFVQVGSFTNPDSAERVRIQLASAWPVQVVQLDSGGGSVFRVRIGPIGDREDAGTALEDAVSLGYADAHLIAARSMQASLQ